MTLRKSLPAHPIDNTRMETTVLETEREREKEGGENSTLAQRWWCPDGALPATHSTSKLPDVRLKGVRKENVGTVPLSRGSKESGTLLKRLESSVL